MIVHRLDPAAKVAATLAFVVAVVATPRGAWWAFLGDAAVLAVVVAAARLPAPWVLRRLRIELPFLAFAALLPVVGDADAATATTLVAKATLGVGAAVVLAGTTPVAELLVGLERLRVPRVLVAIAGFMVRYLDVVAGEASRMRIARLSRGADPRWLWQSRAIASTAGALFVRSYERGERVHLAMLSRGYAGTMPVLHDRAPARGDWLAAGPPIVAAAMALLA